MKKKIASLLLTAFVLCMCIMGTGCGKSTENGSAYDIIHNAVEKTTALDSMACEMDMTMDMDVGGMTMSVPVKADIKVADAKSDSPKIYSNLTMEMLGTSIDMELYSEDGWAYISMMDMNYKTGIAEGANEYDYSDDVANLIQDLPEELLADAKVENGENGTTVTASVSGEQFSEIYADFIKGVNSGSLTDIADVSVENATVSITAANGYLSVYSMEFTMNMEVEGTETSTVVKVDVTYKNPGETVTVTPMEGYEDFEEMDLDSF